MQQQQTKKTTTYSLINKPDHLRLGCHGWFCPKKKKNQTFSFFLSLKLERSHQLAATNSVLPPSHSHLLFGPWLSNIWTTSFTASTQSIPCMSSIERHIDVTLATRAADRRISAAWIIFLLLALLQFVYNWFAAPPQPLVKRKRDYFCTLQTPSEPLSFS